jgi:metal-sulfur cluster biosynthetic enzyme
VSSTSLGDVFVHAILRDRSERYLAVISSSSVKVFDLDGVAQTVSAPSGYGYLSGVTDAKRQIRCGTVADYTFVASSLKVVAMDAAVAPAVARPAANEALVWVKAANYGQSYRVNVNGTLATVTTTTTAGTAISTADIAEQIKTALAGVAGVSIARAGSVLHLTSASTITISATDARANADITAITNSVQSFTSLPAIAPQGYQVEVTGDPTNNFDGYYLKFAPRSGAGTFGEGAWEETVAPGTRYKLDPATMPQVLVRLPAGTWYFGPLNGAALTGLTLPTWGQRTAGDSESAPDPSFVDQTVNDIFVHRGRLGILADEKRIFSRAKDFFSFFPETVTTVLDSDPIDKTASSSKVSVLRYAVPFQGEMLLFSDDYQFRSYATDAALTPATDAITILTSYEIDTGVRPIQMGGSVVFCQSNGDWSQLRQFSVRGAGTALVGDADSITDHVSSYIPSGIFQLAANDTGNSLYCISSKAGYTNRIYTYKFLYRNSGSGVERAQSSWGHWELPGADGILSIVAIQETLYLLVQRGPEVFLEKMPVLDRQSIAAAPYPLLLDRWVSTTTASPAAVRVPAGTYNAVTKVTTWTLPFTIRAATQAWSAYQPGYQGGVLLGAASSGNTITARGDWSAAQVWFGELYPFRYRPSRFKAMRTQGGGQVASNTLRAQIRQARLRYHETGYFQVRVTPTGNRDEAVYTFPGSTVGLLQGVDQGQEGVFRIPMFGRGENITVTIENDTAHPCKFSSMEWTGLITGKGRAVQQ